MMIYALKTKKSSADDPRPINAPVPLDEVTLAAANAKKAKNCSIVRLDAEGQQVRITAAFRPRGKRTAVLFKKHLDAVQALHFSKKLPIRWSLLRYIELKYGGDIPNEAVYSFSFFPRWNGQLLEIQIRCDDWNAAIGELQKK